MATHCPIDLDVARLRREVRATYERVAFEPDGEFHFHRGLDYACRLLCYDRAELEALPDTSTSRFAGVANPHRIRRIRPGETVLDIGSGAGTDLLLAARRTGPRGRVIGVEPTPAMRAITETSARRAGLLGIVELRDGTAEALPVADASVDVVISNGVINLAPDKEQAFREIARVLRPGGHLQLGDVAIETELSLDSRRDADLWAA